MCPERSWQKLWARGEAVARDMGVAFLRDNEVCPRTGGWRLPPLRTPASQFSCCFSVRQIFTRDPESWRISSRTLKNGRDSRFWMLWEKLWEYQNTPSGELLSDESCSGDFIDDGDLIPLAHRKAKTDCQEYFELWTDSTS